MGVLENIREKGLLPGVRERIEEIRTKGVVPSVRQRIEEITTKTKERVGGTGLTRESTQGGGTTTVVRKRKGL